MEVVVAVAVAVQVVALVVVEVGIVEEVEVEVERQARLREAYDIKQAHFHAFQHFYPPAFLLVEVVQRAVRLKAVVEVEDYEEVDD